jgi:hypothetical protein
MRDETPIAAPSGIVTAGAWVAALLTLAAVAYEYSVVKDLRALTEVKAVALARSQETLSSLEHQIQSGAAQLAARTGNKPDPQDHRQNGAARARYLERLLESSKADAQRFLNSDPSIRATVEKISRMQYQAMNGAFFRRQNLTSQQIDQLENASAETWIQTLAIRPGGAIYPTELQPSPDMLTSILGAEGYQQFLAYQRSLPAVSFAEQVATEAGYASAPLSPAQQDKIADLISGASNSFQNGKMVSLEEIDWETVLNQIGSAGLSPTQSDALQRLVANQQYNTTLQQAIWAHTAPR